MALAVSLVYIHAYNILRYKVIGLVRETRVGELEEILYAHGFNATMVQV